MYSCAQTYVPSGMIEKEDYDRKLNRLLDHKVPVIGVDSLYNNMSEFTILDARETVEWDVSKIPNATYVGYKDFEIDEIDQKLNKEDKIVVYCSVGYRSEKITNKLKNAGYENVYNLYGSIFEWANRGYPLMAQDGDTTDRVHVYNKKWGQWMTNPDYQKIY